MIAPETPAKDQRVVTLKCHKALSQNDMLVSNQVQSQKTQNVYNHVTKNIFDNLHNTLMTPVKKEVRNLLWGHVKKFYIAFSDFLLKKFFGTFLCKKCCYFYINFL